MSHFCSSVSSTTLSAFGLVEQFSKGLIKCGYKIAQSLENTQLESKIIHIYFAYCHEHKDELKNNHCLLYFKDINQNYYKLELQCLEKKNEQQVYLERQQEAFQHDYQYTSKKTTLYSIIEYINKKFENSAYNSLINDCSKFCYDIINKFCLEKPQHTPESKKKVIAIFFCSSPIKISGNILHHGYIIVKTHTDYWKFEIGGCKNAVILNMEKCNKQFEYIFKATNLKNVTIKDIIERTEKHWGNKFYSTIGNNCFDYCKFIMQEFTNSSRNKSKIEIQEQKTMVIGGLTVAGVSAFVIAGAKTGKYLGPVGSLVGGLVGGLFAGLFSLAAAEQK